MMWWHNMPWGNVGWLGGLVSMFGGLLILGLLVVLVIWLVGGRRGVGPDGRQDSHPAVRPTPLEIARERYAKGEITREEFQRLQDDLKA